MDPEQRPKFFSENKTSKIGYLRGIPDVEKYLYNPSSNEEDMLLALYRQHTKQIKQIHDYIKGESESKQPYK